MASVTSEKVNLSQWNKKGDFQVVVGIDFGTDGSGVAWSMTDSDGQVFVDQEINGNAQFVDTKTKTNILLDSKGGFIAFGREATEKYIRQIEEDDSDEESIPSNISNANNKKSASWLYFSQFKMALYKSAIKKQSRATKQDQKQEDDVSHKYDIKRTIRASNGTKLDSRTVFVAALRFMKDYAFDMFKRHKVEISDPSKIKWVLTVPAIWSDTSKGLMERWAMDAGLVTGGRVLNQLVIAYEPDCASISIRQEILSMIRKRKVASVACNNASLDDEKQSNHLQKQEKQYLGPDEKYLLLDLGGGTADIACHQVIDDCSVKEVYQPSGGAWGSSCIDRHFFRLLSDILPAGWIREFGQQHPSDYTVLRNNFCRAKESFYARDQDVEGDPSQQQNEQRRAHNIELPFEMIAFMEDKLEKYNELQQLKNLKQYETIEDFVATRDFLGCTGKWILNESTLELDYTVWTHMFDDVIDRIIDHCSQLLQSSPLKDGQCKYLCLVGGFSASKYLQKRMIYELGPKSEHNLVVIRPKRPSLSVVDGAVRLGLRPDYIESRVLSKTYGIKVNSPISKWNLDELDPELVQKHRYFNKRAQQDYLHYIFHPYARKGDEVKLTDVAKTTPFYASKKNVVGIEVYASDEANPVFITGKPVAKQNIALPENWDIKKTFPISFFFSDTKIRVFADIDGIEEHEKEIKLEYEF